MPPLRPRLTGRTARGEFEKQFYKAKELDAVDPLIAAMIVQSGLDDGGPAEDDKIQVTKVSIDAGKLKPSQTTMVLADAIEIALRMLRINKIGGNLGAMISADNYIMDGHHRWAGTILAGGGNVGGYKAGLLGPELLRVLNIISKGAFGIRHGNPGKGSLTEFTPANVVKLLTRYTLEGVGGNYPVSVEEVRRPLEDHWGTVEAGIEGMAANVNNMSKTVPSWAPDRAQMPVIDPHQVGEAANLMESGMVDWQPPYKQARLRRGLIRLAHAHPEFRSVLLPLLKR